MAKHKPRQFWAEHVAAAQASGTSKADYCREHSLDYKTLLRWISRRRRRQIRACDLDCEPHAQPGTRDWNRAVEAIRRIDAVSHRRSQSANCTLPSVPA